MTARRSGGDKIQSPLGIYQILYDHYGNLDWWPAEGPFDVMVGAILTQRTAWRNVELAIERMRDAGVDGPEALMALSPDALEELIRPSGTYRQKARRLRALFTLVTTTHGGTLETFLTRPKTDLRKDLLSVEGIGPETADCIILYAAGQPAFVVDSYTRRVLGRLGVDAGRSYDDVVRWITSDLPEDAALYNNFHAALVELAKGFCRVKPECPGCPFVDICPTNRGSRPP